MTSRREFFLGGLAALARPDLKITAVKVHPVHVGGLFATTPPKFSSDYDLKKRRWFGPFAQLAGAIVVEVRTGQGITGYGLGGGGGAGAYIIEHHLSDLLIGANPLNVELLWDQMYGSTLFYGRKGLAVMALSGVDLALWDIRGKHAGLPVYRLLGGPVKEKVPAYYTGFEFEKALELGFRAFKYPIRDGVNEGREGMRRIVEQLRAARKVIGPDNQLMIDCLCQWDVPYTLEMVERLQEFRLYFVEEPLSPDDIAGYAQLCREVRGPMIASGEHEYTRFGFSELLRQDAVRILQPDISWSGGLTEVRRIAALAAARSLPVIPHRGGSPYGLNFILATPNCPMAESFGTLEKASDFMTAMTSRFERGYYIASEKPGFGVELSESVLKRE